jgi:hypothetical protein
VHGTKFVNEYIDSHPGVLSLDAPRPLATTANRTSGE